ncbi:EamA family transporter RarD [Pontimonas sp.]|uniref:EamA family transporter RarD n=1 Tax=Pontimonas sp. TaxID=2304492 RepID=UPI0028703704|nr:EamA family transporter RarD [Pontimonas sp.]MDR9396114.1 EamA family transporter RarD [Pontimonas sp.]MDR9434711.1 EamA family transporter RarD [Pontimonas sp.]
MTSVDPKSTRAGYGYALSAYSLWGVLPLYFVALAPTSPLEILAWRVVLSLVFCLLILLLTGHLQRAFAVLGDRRSALLTAAAGVLILFNWGIFVFATQTGHVVDAALGYFINPLVTALLGVVVLRERLRIAQWTALGLGAVAVGVLVVGYGEFPWISLGLAFSFGFYGLVKKGLGQMPALTGLTLETLWVTPLAVGLLVWIGLTDGLVATGEGTGLLVLVSLSGVATSVPLLLFAAATRRLPLSTVGLLQYLNPILQALLGIVVLMEPMPIERWFGFAIIVLALGVFIGDAVKSRRFTG